MENVEQQKAEVPAEETKKPERTIEEVNAEYTKICGVIGERSYRVEVLKAEIDHLHQKAHALDQEARAINENAAKQLAEAQQ